MQNNFNETNWAKIMLKNWVNRKYNNAPSAKSIAILLAHADIELDLGGSLTGLKLSPNKANSDLIRQILSLNEQNICDYMIVWDNDKSAILNLIHDKKSVLH